MTLSQFAAQTRLRIFEDLREGRAPSVGTYSEVDLEEGRKKEAPQMGATVYKPDHIRCEFVFPDISTSATVLSVHVPTPERVVFLPVPEWVVESIWQGEISGTFHFESHAKELLAKLAAELGEQENLKWFEKQQAKRRE
jgi:hypothetical protein